MCHILADTNAATEIEVDTPEPQEIRHGCPQPLQIEPEAGLELEEAEHRAPRLPLAKIRIEGILTYIDQHLCEDLTVRMLARRARLSISHFRTSFVSMMMMTPAKYVKSRRMHKAAALLTAERLAIRDVMSRVGLMDKSHFIRDFKSRYGTTPGNYYRFQRRKELLRLSRVTDQVEGAERRP